MLALAGGAYVLTRPSTKPAQAAPVSASPSLPVPASNASRSDAGRSKSSAPEPAAIKLWDTAEKILSLQKPNVRWENNAIHLDKAALPDGTIKQADMIVRAEMLMNDGSASAQISGRVLRDGTGPKGSYSLSLKSGLKEVKLLAHIGDVTTELRAWPLSRSYLTGEWLPLELRIVGDEITASAEGRMLGSVKDSSVRGVGGVQLYATQDGWFRNVEYVPLDKPALSSSPNLPLSASSSSSEPTAIKLWDAPEKLPKQTGVTWENNAVRLDGNVAFQANQLMSSDHLLRAKVLMNADAQNVALSVRFVRAAGNNRSFYRLGFSQDNQALILAAVEGDRTREELQRWPLHRKYDPGEWLPLELQIVGNELTASAEGRVLGIVKDKSITGSGIVQLYAGANGYFRDIEYVPLGKAEAPTSPSLPLSKSSTPEPAAIKLWDTPDKILSLQKPNVRWENNAIHLTDKAGLPDGTIKQANVIVRAEVLMNAGSESAQIGGRVLRDGTGPKGHYNLALKPGLTAVKLVANTDVSTELRAWPLSRAYRTDEWLRLELRIVGDEITASAEGRVLGTVKDSSIKGAGGVMLYAAEDGWFRNVEYVPLDQAVVSSSPSLPLTKSSSAPPTAIKLWNAPDRIPPGEGIVWEDGALRVGTFPASYNATKSSSGAILRADVRFSSGAEGAQISIRQGKGWSADDRSYYTLDVLPEFRLITLKIVNGKREGTELQRWKVPEDYQGDKWASLELQTLAGELTATFDGKVLGTVRDSTLTEFTGFTLWAKPQAYFRDIEYVPLDKTPASVSPSLPLSKSSTLEPAAIKPWGTAAEVLAMKRNVSWVDNALHMVGKGAVRIPGAQLTDLILRAEVLTSPASMGPQICARVAEADTRSDTHYKLGLETGGKSVALAAVVKGAQQQLGRWPLERSYGPDEWLSLELRIIGDQITASAGGHVLGTVADTSIREGGGLQIYANQDGRFRNVEYVPLDKLDSSPGSRELSPSSEPWQDMLFKGAGLGLSGAVERVSEGLRMTGPCSAHLRYDHLHNDLRLARDGAIRMVWTFGGVRPQLRARLKDGHGLYLVQARSENEIVLALHNNITNSSTDLRTFPPRQKLKVGQDYELEFRVVGTVLTVKLNGEVLGSLTDTTNSEGWFGVGVGTANPDTTGSPTLVKALEVLNLDAPDLPKPAAAPIKLWDSPEKLDDPRAEWKDGAVHLPDNAGLYARPLSRDAIIRASIRMNADAKGPQINLRHLGDDKYRLAINPKDNYVVLGTVSHEKVTSLNQWPLARRYREDEWLRLELRVVGNQLTASADGTELGTITDETFSQPGGAGIFGTNGYFRDIEYVPLDKASSVPPSIATYPQPPTWTDVTATLRAAGNKFSSVVVEGEWIKAATSNTLSLGARASNPIVRVLFSGRVDIRLRRALTETVDDCYLGSINRSGSASIVRTAPSRVELVAMAASHSMEGEHEAVFAAQGDTLTLWLDGTQVVTAQDKALTSGTIALGLTKGDPNGDGRIKKVEWGELPDITAAPAAAKADAIWKSRWHKPGKLRSAGTDMNGKPFDLKEAEPYDDFVQVAALEPSNSNGLSWAGLRSTGDLILSNGVVQLSVIGIKRGAIGVRKGGMVARPEITLTDPVSDFSWARAFFLSGKPWVAPYADVEGTWHLISSAYESSSVDKPDLTTPPKVTKVIISSWGIGVLREDGTLRFWGTKEIKLPDIISREVRDVVELGSEWGILKRTGIVHIAAMAKTASDSVEFLAQPIIRPSAVSGVNAIVSSGYSIVGKHVDGRWSTGFAGVVDDALAKLHTENNESFSVFRGDGKEGILWIDPVK